MRTLAPALVLGLAIPVAAQASPSPLPLQCGARWVYRESRLAEPPAAQATANVQVTDEGGFVMPDGERIHQLRIASDDGAEPTFECWSVRPDGVHLHATRAPQQRGAIVPDAAPMRLLALPDTPREWTWNGPVADGDPTATLTHRATLVDPAATIRVPAGTFLAAQVRITSERDGKHEQTRDLWFAPATGLVRDELHSPSGIRTRELVSFEPGRDTRRERLLRYLDKQLANPHFPTFNNTPWIRWIDDGPDAMVLPGRIAVVKAERWCRCFYVDDDDVYAFDPNEADRTAVAARAAFGGTKTANPPPHVSVTACALLLARAEAERLHLSRVRAVEPTLEPKRALPKNRERHAHVEVEGGAPDGTTRRVAVWLTIDRSSDIQLVTDALDPWPLPR